MGEWTVASGRVCALLVVAAIGAGCTSGGTPASPPAAASPAPAASRLLPLTGTMAVPIGTQVGVLSSQAHGLFSVTASPPSTPLVGTSSFIDDIMIMTPGCEGNPSRSTEDVMDAANFFERASGVWDADGANPTITATSTAQDQIRTTPVTVTTQWNLVPKD